MYNMLRSTDVPMEHRRSTTFGWKQGQLSLSWHHRTLSFVMNVEAWICWLPTRPTTYQAKPRLFGIYTRNQYPIVNSFLFCAISINNCLYVDLYTRRHVWRIPTRRKKQSKNKKIKYELIKKKNFASSINDRSPKN